MESMTSNLGNCDRNEGKSWDGLRVKGVKKWETEINQDWDNCTKNYLRLSEWEDRRRKNKVRIDMGRIERNKGETNLEQIERIEREKIRDGLREYNKSK